MTGKVNGRRLYVAAILYLGVSLTGTGYVTDKTFAMETNNSTIQLPAPREDSEFSLEQALRERRSVREFRDDELTLLQLSQLLWSAQGITDSRGFRTAPSAGALYPLEVYVMVGAVSGLSPGVYQYRPRDHQLVVTASQDRRKEVESAAWGQDWVSENAALIVFSSVDSRTTSKYGRRGIRYVHIEVGHAAQNVMLQAEALGLGAAAVGAFDDDLVKQILNLPENEHALYLIPVGKPRQ